MLQDLVTNIYRSFTSYLKWRAGERYAGNELFSLTYVKQCPELNRRRKKDLINLSQILRDALRRDLTAKQLTESIIDYISSWDTGCSFYLGLRPPSHLRNNIIQAIMQYSPSLLRWKKNKVELNPNAPDNCSRRSYQMLQQHTVVEQAHILPSEFQNLCQTMQTLQQEVVQLRQHLAKQEKHYVSKLQNLQAKIIAVQTENLELRMSLAPPITITPIATSAIATVQV